MPNNKDQHFVPRFYLRNFGSGNSIGMFNIQRRRHLPNASIPGQCQRAYFYGRDSLIDDRLRLLETSSGRIIRNIISSGQLPACNHDDYITLVEFVAVQLGRTPDAIEIARKTRRKLGEAYMKVATALKGDKVPDLLSLQDADPLRLLTESVQLYEEIYPLFLDLRPLLLVNRTSDPFITSDFPVVLHNPWCRGWTGSGVHGVMKSGLIVELALSPWHALLLFDSEVYMTSAGRESVILVDHRDVKTLNAMRLLGADSNLYYKNDTNSAKLIDDLPFGWHKRRSELVRISVYHSQEDNSYLVSNFLEQPDVRVQLRCLRVAPRQAKLSLVERINSIRVGSRLIEQRLGMAESREGSSRVSQLPYQSWQMVEKM